MKSLFAFLMILLPLISVGQGDFETVIENPITSVKDQYKSGTCWNFATIGFVESEILRKTGKTYDLCEMFVANKNYMERAVYIVRMHGNAQFCQGGEAADVFEIIKRHGICPEDAMPAPGSLVGDSLCNFDEFASVFKPKLQHFARGGNENYDVDNPVYNYVRTINGWQDSIQNILDKYIGKCPTSFEYEGKTYTPNTFAASLGLDWDNYMCITSFTHHPFYENFVIEAVHKWRSLPSYNLPLDKMMKILDTALENGFCVAWGGDVTGNFSYYGIAKLPGSPKVTQELRQKQWDNWTFTYDHVMLIYGIAKDASGKKYYMVKNSWGRNCGNNGIWYMSEDFMRLNTTYIYLCKDAINKKDLRK